MQQQLKQRSTRRSRIMFMSKVVSVPVYKDEQAIQFDGGRGAMKSETTTVHLADYPLVELCCWLLQNVDKEGHLRQVDDMVVLPFLHGVSC